ncbi:MAG: glycosyltransferase family 4 protein [Crenarchaeota archaeon]|nr:glycosyltransferase family 4 protein [Thermoproteota archaeon]
MRDTIVIQVSPYPPEPGADYHEQLAHQLSRELKAPVIVLAGLNHLKLHEAIKQYGVIEIHDRVIVYRAFWAPRIAECKNPITIVRYLIASLKALAQVVRTAKKYAKKVIAHFHYGPTTWPGALLGEHYPLGMILARALKARVFWTIHAFLTPHQLLQESRERRLSTLLALPLIAYYLTIARIAATACHKIIALVDNPSAPITTILSRLLGKRVLEEVHPPFKPLAKPSINHRRDKVLMICIGYIRKEKGYHKLLQWLANLKIKDPSIYRRLKVIIAGTIDRKKREDIEYLRNLISIKNQHKLTNVEFIIKNLSKEEFHYLLLKGDIIWCAYTKKYGPSGILAWARAFSKYAIIIGSEWSSRDHSYRTLESTSFSEHTRNLIRIYNDT